MLSSAYRRTHKQFALQRTIFSLQVTVCWISPRSCWPFLRTLQVSPTRSPVNASWPLAPDLSLAHTCSPAPNCGAPGKPKDSWYARPVTFHGPTALTAEATSCAIGGLVPISKISQR